MKKTSKSKLRLNSQTIRSLREQQIRQIEGGRVLIYDNTDLSDGCRGCG